MSSDLQDGAETGPWIGGLLRHVWQRVRERIYLGVVSAGYTELSRAHVSMFRTESLNGQRPTHIAEQMNVTKQSVNDLLRDLERLGYIALQPDPHDSRARLIRFTSRGRRLDAAVRAEARAAERELAEILGARRFKALREALVKLSPPTDGPAGVIMGTPRYAMRRRGGASDVRNVSGHAQSRVARRSGS